MCHYEKEFLETARNLNRTDYITGSTLLHETPGKQTRLVHSINSFSPLQIIHKTKNIYNFNIFASRCGKTRKKILPLYTRSCRFTPLQVAYVSGNVDSI